jgi:hypothetical protein
VHRKSKGTKQKNNELLITLLLRSLMLFVFIYNLVSLCGWGSSVAVAVAQGQLRSWQRKTAGALERQGRQPVFPNSEQLAQLALSGARNVTSRQTTPESNSLKKRNKIIKYKNNKIRRNTVSLPSCSP